MKRIRYKWWKKKAYVVTIDSKHSIGFDDWGQAEIFQKLLDIERKLK